MIFNNYIFAILQEHTILFVRFQLLVNLLISRSDHISDKIEVNQLNLIFKTNYRHQIMNDETKKFFTGLLNKYVSNNLRFKN